MPGETWAIGLAIIGVPMGVAILAAESVISGKRLYQLL